MNKILKIEALRGFVALYVAFAHIFTFLPITDKDHFLSFLWKFGDAGVAIFFVISGFVIQLSYARGRDKSFKSYFFKRLLRIYIPLISVFITTFIILALQNNIGYISLANIAMNLLMLQHNDTVAVFWPLFGNGPLWSLSFEWWYYMIFFVLINYLPKKINTIVYTACILATILHLFCPVFVVKMITDMSLWWLGVEMAKVYMHTKSGNPFTFKTLSKPLSVIVLSTVILYFGESPFYVYLFNGLVCIVAGLLWASISWRGYNQTMGLFLPLGQISYTIYISHFPLIVQATYLDRFIPSLGMYRYIIYATVCLLFCYMVEVLLYPIIHRFMMNKIVYKYFIKKKITA